MVQQGDSLGDTRHLLETGVEDYHYASLVEGRSCAMEFVQGKTE
jgi:hypothetical protein